MAHFKKRNSKLQLAEHLFKKPDNWYLNPIRIIVSNQLQCSNGKMKKNGSSIRYNKGTKVVKLFLTPN